MISLAQVLTQHPKLSHLKLQEVWIQGEEIPGIRKLRLLPGTTARELKNLAALLRTTESKEPLLLFREGYPVAMEDHLPISVLANGHLNFHLHRCAIVKVTINLGQRSATLEYSPATSFAEVLNHITTRGITQTLFLNGTETRPEPFRHIGAYVRYPDGALQLDFK